MRSRIRVRASMRVWVRVKVRVWVRDRIRIRIRIRVRVRVRLNVRVWVGPCLFCFHCQRSQVFCASTKSHFWKIPSLLKGVGGTLQRTESRGETKATRK